MGKFRSKLKRNTKGKNWAHGQSSTANPENQKHRNRAKSRYLKSDLNTAPGTDKPSLLTLDAIYKHEARQSFATGKEPTVNDVAQSLKSFNFDNDGMTETKGGTFKTFQTFASNYTACTNMSFQKLLNGFRGDSEQHKEMLAILAAVSEVINERGGTQSSTEYFLGLMQTLEASKDDSTTNATLSLLAMGIKTVPQAVLRKKFSDASEALIDLMEQFMDSDNQNILRGIIGCLTVILKAQEYSMWNLPSTTKIFDSILAFVTHSKPKIRKSAQHAITSIIHGSCFMKSPKIEEEENENTVNKTKLSTIKYHPAGGRIMTFCNDLFSPENIANNQTYVLHALGLLRDVTHGFKSDDIKTVCELLLSMMTAANVLIRTNCFHTLHSLFTSKTENMNSILVGKLITALYDYRPDKSDTRQTLAWLTVIKQGYICLANLDLNLCNNMLPKFVEICTNDLWLSERVEISTNTTNALTDILEQCVQPCCIEKEAANRNRTSITKIIMLITKILSTPFGHVTSQVILTLSIVYKATGKYFSDALKESLFILGSRYDTANTYQIQIEHAILAAIESVGPESVLNAIPLKDHKGDVSLNKSWILPLLRESITGSTLEYFTNYILKLASNCNANWHKFKAEGNVSYAHTYELLCCQLWGLFPGFCRKPKDPHNFRFLAKTLGMILNDNPELRPPVLDGLKELIANGDDECKNELGKYAKNFLPRLFNIYTTKPEGTHEAEIRTTTFVVIEEYLKVTPQTVLDEMFETAMSQLKSSPPGLFLTDAIFDIVESLALYQTEGKLHSIYDKYITVILKKKQKKDVVAKDDVKLRSQQKKAYKLLQDILQNTNPGCVAFAKNQTYSIEKLLLATQTTTCDASRVARITCLKVFLDKQDNLTTTQNIIQPILLESVMALHDFSRKENIAQDIIRMIGDIYQEEDRLNDFIDVIIAGLAGDSIMIKNTIYALKVAVQHLTGNFTVNTLEFILEQIMVFAVNKSRNEAEASISFLVTFVKVLPSPLVANHLSNIVNSLSAMAPDIKRFCRIQVGYIFKKLCKKFGANEIIKMVPGNDEGTHKRLKQIRKLLAKEERQKIADRNGDDNSDDDDLDDKLEKKSHTIDEILADSDSDSELETNEKVDAITAKQTKKNKRTRSETYIQETPESIVDLNDINSIGKISSTRPAEKRLETETDDTKKTKKNSNRGFKTAQDGRLIIDENSDMESDNNETDVPMTIDGVDEDDDLFAKKKRGIKEDSESDDDDNETVGPSRKRKAMDARSMASGKSGMGSSKSKYVAGGKGIHRPVAESVKSGVSRASSFGSTYKAKKAAGDVKKKGQLDPYAYIPLSRSNLNKRKQAKNMGQFNSIVRGARKGAAAGSKNKVHKSYKK